MRYAHIFCGWSKRLKPNENRRAFIRSLTTKHPQMSGTFGQLPFADRAA